MLGDQILFVNDYITLFLGVVILLYAVYLRQSLPNFIERLFQQPVFRVLVISLIAYQANKQFLPALLIGLGFVLILGSVDVPLKEGFNTGVNEISFDATDNEMKMIRIQPPISSGSKTTTVIQISSLGNSNLTVITNQDAILQQRNDVTREPQKKFEVVMDQPIKITIINKKEKRKQGTFEREITIPVEVYFKARPKTTLILKSNHSITSVPS